MLEPITDDEIEVVHKGVQYITNQHPNNKIPIQLIFLFAGKGELENYIVRELLILGYTITRIWYIDNQYLHTTDELKKTIQIISGLHITEADIANGKTLHLRHSARKSKPETTKITTDNFFKVANAEKRILMIESIELLQTFMDEYVKPDEPIAMLAIHPQHSGSNRQELFGGFYKMYFTKYNRSFAIFKRQSPYIFVFQPETYKNLTPTGVYKKIHDIITGQQEAGKRIGTRKETRKIYVGKRGGKYILVKDKKKYIQ